MKNIKLAFYTLLMSMLLSSFGAQAGPSMDKKDDSESDIEWELSYLAKRLLDLKGADSYVLERKAFTKPFIGICTDMKNPGIALTCVTPDSQASKSGLKTGDLLTSINGVSMSDQARHFKETKEPSYWNIVHNMKVGDKLEIELLRAGETMKIDLIVGSLQHPAFRFEAGK